MPTSQSSIGTQVSAQTAANVLSGERSYKELKFIATGDPETELVNLVNAFVCEFLTQTPSTQIFNNRRIATVLDYLAHRYRESAKEIEREQEQFRQVSAIPRTTPYIAGSEWKGPEYWAGGPLGKTASEIRSIDEAMRCEMEAKMMSELYKKTMR